MGNNYGTEEQFCCRDSITQDVAYHKTLKARLATEIDSNNLICKVLFGEREFLKCAI